MDHQRLRPNGTSPEAVRSAVFYKTHKTASTTVADIFFRYGTRRGLKMYRPPSVVTRVAPGQVRYTPHHFIHTNVMNRRVVPAELSFFHFDATGANVSWPAIRQWYHTAVPNAKFITIAREPISHYLSYYYFFIEPMPRSLLLEEYVDARKDENSLLRDFAIRNPAKAQEFLEVC